MDEENLCASSEMFSVGSTSTGALGPGDEDDEEDDGPPADDEEAVREEEDAAGSAVGSFPRFSCWAG